MKKIDPTSKTFFTDVIDFFKDSQQALNGIFDKVPDGFKPQLTALKERVDKALANLAEVPTTQVPAAQEAAYSLQHLASALQYFKELYDGAVGSLNKLVEEYTPKLQTLNSIEARIEKGELVDANGVKTKVDAAVGEALTAERNRVKVLSTRRQALCAANLPVPADDEVLAGDDAAFTTVKTTANDRHTVLKDRGIEQSLNSAEVAELLYGPAKDYDRFLKLAGKATGKPGTAEPLAGDPGAGDDSKLFGV